MGNIGWVYFNLKSIIVISQEGIELHKVYYIKKPNKTEIVVEGSLITLIPKGFTSAISKGLSGEKTFRVKDIISVQLKKPGFTNGYIQFGILGDSGHKQGVWNAVSDENTVMFTKKYYEDMLELKNYIDTFESEPVQQATSNIAEELTKIANLYKEGVLSESEYNTLKGKLLK